MPGLLQTAEYARALFIAAGTDDAKADELVTVRLGRQSIFDRADPPHVVTILGESVLHRLIGSPAIMSDQLSHLGGMAERANVQVQVVPAARGANAGLSGAFALASCEGAPDVLNINAVEDVTEERRPLVRHATVIFDLVRGDALPREETRTLVLEAAEQWKTRQRRAGASPATAATEAPTALRLRATSRASSPSETPKTQTARS